MSTTASRTTARPSRSARTAALAGRLVLGGYLATHGAQKLFGAFGGPGLDAAGQGFESMGLSPGKQMATLAAVSELAGGVLTATGVADPLGPLAIAGSMVVASAVHRKGGPLMANGGYELALTNLALATVVGATATEGVRLSPRLPRRATAVVSLGAAALTGYSLFKLLTFTPPVVPDVESDVESDVAIGTETDAAVADVLDVPAVDEVSAGHSDSAA